MYYSGIADEAGQDLATQLRAHRELGWKHIELRTVDGANITDVTDSKFDEIVQSLQQADMRVSCFASQIANWARPIDSDFDLDVSELRRAIPRMHCLGTRFIRCMSYPNSDPPLDEAEWREQAMDRMRTLAQIASEGDVVLVHENCHGWGSQGAREANAMMAEIDSPSLRIVFDTGNPICDSQDVWELYRSVREHIAYVHIKDYNAESDGVVACFPGEGKAYVGEIVRDLLNSKYDGGFSIEPHIESVIHLDQHAADPQVAYDTYIAYGKRFMDIVRTVQGEERG